MVMLICVCSPAYSEPPNQPSPMSPSQPSTMPLIIDTHCHAAGLGGDGSGCFVSPKLKRNFRFCFFLRGYGVKKKELLEKGDGIVIQKISKTLHESSTVKKAVVFAMDGVVDASGNLDEKNTEMYVPNEYVEREARRYDNILWAASVNPLRHDACQRLEWSKAHGAVLVKWLPGIMGFDPADPRCDKFYAKLVELKLPLLIHVGPEKTFLNVNEELLRPEIIDPAIKAGVTVIVAHVGAGGVYKDKITGEKKASLDEVVKRIRENKNVYADLSAFTLQKRLKDIKPVMNEPALRGRLLYGSDYPLTEIKIISSPWFCLFRVPLKEIWRITHLKNMWDRDVALKRALGFREESFYLPAQLLQPQAVRL